MDMFSSAKGSSFDPGSKFVQQNQMPQSTSIVNPMDMGNANQANGNVIDAIQRQQAFVNASQNQGGMANQNYLASVLQNQMNGGGPNPAQMQLAESTGNNIKNQAAMMAGQRGVSQNAGLMGKHIADQGSAIQQQAANQAAIMNMQQQLAAQQQYGNLAGQQVGNYQSGLQGLGNMAQNEQGQVLGSLAAGNTANVGMQSNVNNVGASMAGVNAGMQGNMNTVSGGMAQGNQKFQNDLMAGGIKGVGQAMSIPGLAAHGGMVGRYADGGQIDSGIASFAAPSMDIGAAPGPQSFVGQMLNSNNMRTPEMSTAMADAFKGKPKVPNVANGTGLGAMSPADLGTGASTGIEASNAGDLASLGMLAAAKGGQINGKLKSGGGVPGKPKVPGDSYQNDTVSAKLSPGEIVIPNHITQGENAPQKAADFVAAILAKKGGLRRG